jgi:choline dehydrogenase-like flavoprotein
LPVIDPTREADAGRYSQCDNDRKNIAFAKQTLHEIFEAGHTQDVLLTDRYAHLVGGCRMGSEPERSVVGSDHRAWGYRTCSSPTAA